MNAKVMDKGTRELLNASLAKVKELKSRLDVLERRTHEPIAIIGMGCRFPGGADSPDVFWKLLDTGRDAVQPLDPRWSLVGARPSDDVPRWAGTLTEPVDCFDAAFFGISRGEARSLDPQHRLLLEVAWEALEHTGIVPRSLQGSRTGVFVGACSTDYADTVDKQPRDERDAYSLIGNLPSVAAGRLSYTLGLQGPCLTVDTACSSSLVAIHLACLSLRNAECDLALAAGVNLLLSPDVMEALTRLQALSPDGRCRAFDASANGFVRGEGCGLLVLKRLSDARRDRDRICALIRGSATNQDGRSTALTAPNVLAQETLLRDALKNARLTPEAIGYIETHGTGTSLGDPIEIEALRAVLGQPRPDGAPCVLGALKTNIGHLEAAAGVAGLIKAVLALTHERIPRNLNFRTLNPRIRLQGTALTVASEPVSWPRSAQPRFAGVSAFGLSGTNAHVVLEEAPASDPVASAPARASELLVLSAKSAPALDAMAARLRHHLDAYPELQLGDLAFCVATQRTPMDHRLAIVATSHETLKTALDAVAQDQNPPGTVRGRLTSASVPKTVFVFPGQGSQWLGMGRQLIADEPVFRTALQTCDRAIQAEAGWSLLAELAATESTSHMDRVDIVQPLLFAIEVALAALWRSWGIIPDLVVGHSMGEVAAAHVAGALSLDDAVAIICRRSLLLQRISGQGQMAVVELSLSEAQTALRGYDDRLAVAVSNGPRSSVLSGEPAALAEVLSALQAQGIAFRRVNVDVASHSPQVDPLCAELLAALDSIKPRQTSISMRSTVTNAALTGLELGAKYWVDNLRQPVRFADAVGALLESGHGLFVEMSPHPILTHSVEELRRAAGRQGAATGSLRRGHDQRPAMLEALGTLWVQGYPVEWELIFPEKGEGGCHVPLPTYPWQRERHWLDAPAISETARDVVAPTTRRERAKGSSKRELSEWFYRPTWQPQKSVTPLSASPPAGFGAAAPSSTGQRETVESAERLSTVFLTEVERSALNRPTTLSTPPSAWLLFADDDLLNQALRKRLQASGQTVTVVVPGASYASLSAHEFTIRPGVEDDYHALFTDLAHRRLFPQHIIHAWNLAQTPSNPNARQTFIDAQERGFYSLLFLTKALCRKQNSQEIWLEVLTRRMHAVRSSDKLVPERAPIVACCRVIPQEYPSIRCRSIDLDTPSTDADAELLPQLIHEFSLPPSTLPLAFRNGERFELSYERCSLEEHTRPSRLRPGGVYLITGGLGDLGLILAQELARQVQAKLILVGRSGLPDQTTWQQHLATAAENDPIANKIRHVQALTELGAEVLVLCADVSNESQMAQVITQARQRFGAIHGVIHSAGAIDHTAFRMISDTGREESERHFASKVHGLLVLDRLFADEPLDFCLLMSSLSAVLGGLGLLPYAASNLYLDVFAQAKRSQGGTSWMSVDWDLWGSSKVSDAERVMGTTVIRSGATLSEFGMTQQEGTEVFRRILAAGDPTPLVVSTGDLHARFQQWVNIDLPDGKTQSIAAASPNEIQQALTKIWTEVLGVEKVGVNDNFFRLGGDSLLAVRLFVLVKKRFGKALPLSTLFQAPTIATLAEFLAERELVEATGCLVPMQPKGSKIPLFWAHGLGGDLLRYYHVVNLIGAEQPVYGFHAPAEPFDQIEAMAAHYIEELLAFRPEGPYALIGYSFGGRIAFEIACQLYAKGLEVSFLGILDAELQSFKMSWDPAFFQHVVQHVITWSNTLLHDGRDVRKTHLQNISSALGNKLKVRLARGPYPPKDVSGIINMEGYPEDRKRFAQVHYQAGIDFVPKRYPGRLTLFRAHRQKLFSIDPTLGWGQVAGEVEIVPIPGAHDDILAASRAGDLADHIVRSLDLAHAGRAQFVHPVGFGAAAPRVDL